MDIQALQKELDDIQEKRNDLEFQLETCKERRDKKLKEKILSDLRILSNRASHINFKLGRYRYPEEEMVEYSPGQKMPANVYHWLIGKD